MTAMESAFATLPSSSWTANLNLKFCAQGCVKCSPVSLSLRSSSSLSSSKRSECSTSWYGDQLKLVTKPTHRTNRRPVRVVFVDQCRESENERDTNAHATKEEPKHNGNGHAPASVQEATENALPRGFNESFSSGDTTAISSVASSTRAPEFEHQHPDADEIWQIIKTEARLESEKEPALASYFYSSVISHRYVLHCHQFISFGHDSLSE